MYKNTSRNNQGRAERIQMKDMPSFPDDMPEDERCEMLREMLQRLEAQIVALHPKSPERKILGKRKFALAAEMNTIRKKPKYPNLGQCFIDAAHKLLPSETYQQIMAEARHISTIRHQSEIRKSDELNEWHKSRGIRLLQEDT